jgi:alkylhydroperoxidase/carboxymuconolactone decarboxylase family protein YurZ
MAAGREMRATYLGANGDQAFAPIAELSPQMEQWVVGELFGKAYANPALELRERSLCTITALLTLHRVEPARNHIRGALANGVPRAELVALLEHLVWYIGLPTAAAGFKVLAEVLAESSDDTPGAS